MEIQKPNRSEAIHPFFQIRASIDLNLIYNLCIQVLVEIENRRSETESPTPVIENVTKLQRKRKKVSSLRYKYVKKNSFASETKYKIFQSKNKIYTYFFLK